MAESDFDEALNDIFDELAVPGTFTPFDGDPVPDVMIYIEEKLEDQPDGYDSIVMGVYKIAEMLVAELPRMPRESDQITVGANTYTVKALLKSDGRTVSVIVV